MKKLTKKAAQPAICPLFLTVGYQHPPSDFDCPFAKGADGRMA
ncbi:hypothetical protein ACFSW6_02165 [Comamonas terrae]|uniref:Uncharacterized protein n=1 Tax=Comamonas terrae TaxID=673548 RepID=A0ABW5UGW4_9BURK